MVQRLQDGVGPSWADQVGNTVHPTTMWSQRLDGGYPGHTIELPATTADINLCATPRCIAVHALVIALSTTLCCQSIRSH